MRPTLSLRGATLLQLLIALVLLWGTRFWFYAANADLTGAMTGSQLWRAALGGLRFDLSALAYFNALFILMRFLPLPLAGKRWWIRASNVVYAACNSLLLALSVGDIPFYRFSGSRLRWTAITDIGADSNAVGIVFGYWRDYWWAYLAVAVGVAVVCLAAFLWHIRPPRRVPYPLRRRIWSLRTLTFLLAGGLTFLCMRGRVGAGNPLAIADAAWYAPDASKINVVLNTPFCVLRSMSRANEVEEVRWMTDEQLAAIRSSEHHVPEKGPFHGRNVVWITVESGGMWWLDSLRLVPMEARHEGLMPFMDSIASRSLVLRHVMATGIRSVEGITAIYGGFPTYGEMLYMPSRYNSNRVDAPARLLHEAGYSTKFYFGANHGSYGIAQFLHLMGFDEVVEREDYPGDDYDGMWGVFDHAMGEYMARDLGSLPRPFLAGWFTLKPHGPWNLPTDWGTDGYRSPELTLERAVEYEDRALRHFFEVARTQPWYDSTLFVITGDHGCRDLGGTRWDTPWIMPHVFAIFHTPDGTLAPGVVDSVVGSQLDLGPTLLGLTGAPRPYVALGRDLLAEAGRGRGLQAKDASRGYALSFIHGAWQVAGPRYLVQLSEDFSRIERVTDVKADPWGKSPLRPGQYDRAETDRMTLWAKAFMQDYTHRLNANTLAR